MPIIDPNPPAWLASLIANEQAIEDQRFAKAAADYQAAAAQWIANCLLDYQSGAPIQPFVRALPTREVFAAVSRADPTFGAAPFTSTTITDPNLQPPVAPPNAIVVGSYHNPLGTGAPAADAATALFQAAVSSALAKIMAALKIT